MLAGMTPSEGHRLGSLNMDISVTVPRLPGPGATVLGSAARFTPGGKGANQAVAAARLGADVHMVDGATCLLLLVQRPIDQVPVRAAPGASAANGANAS